MKNIREDLSPINLIISINSHSLPKSSSTSCRRFPPVKSSDKLDPLCACWPVASVPVSCDPHRSRVAYHGSAPELVRPSFRPGRRSYRPGRDWWWRWWPSQRWAAHAGSLTGSRSASSSHRRRPRGRIDDEAVGRLKRNIAWIFNYYYLLRHNLSSIYYIFKQIFSLFKHIFRKSVPLKHSYIVLLYIWSVLRKIHA